MNQPVQMIGLGEVLWDCFPDRKLPGGAPANVAFHAQQLGLSAAVASRIGQDDLGREISEFLASQGLSTRLVQCDTVRQTGTVTVWPESESGVNYRFLENSAWDFLEPDAELLAAITRADAICFGTLAQRRPLSRRTIQRCLQVASDDCLIVYDVNLRPPFVVKEWIVKSLEKATILKLNGVELKILSQMFAFHCDEEIRFAKWLLDVHRNLRLVCVTRGGDGCLAVTCDDVIELPGVPTQVADTVGAGDAFTSAIIYGFLEHWPLGKTLELANRFGSLVASHSGAMPSLRSEIDGIKSELDWAFRDTPAC